jgi:hypothetical protein
MEISIAITATNYTQIVLSMQCQTAKSGLSVLSVRSGTTLNANFSDPEKLILICGKLLERNM